MLLLDIWQGKTKIERFKPEVGEGDPLWDAGWRVGLKKIGPFKFLIWTKPEQLDFKYTINEVAKRLEVTEETVRRWCREEKIRFVKLPLRRGEYRFSEEDVNEFVSRQKQEN